MHTLTGNDAATPTLNVRQQPRAARTFWLVVGFVGITAKAPIMASVAENATVPIHHLARCWTERCHAHR